MASFSHDAGTLLNIRVPMLMGKWCQTMSCTNAVAVARAGSGGWCLPMPDEAALSIRLLPWHVSADLIMVFVVVSLFCMFFFMP